MFELVYANCDLVLVEGDLQTSVDKIEVWRADAGGPPLSKKDPSICAVVTDDSIDVNCPVLARNSLPYLADWLCLQLGLPATKSASQ